MKKLFINWLTSKEPVSALEFAITWGIIMLLLFSPLYLPRW